MIRRVLLSLLVSVGLASLASARPESIRVVTYNVENWRESFQAFKLSREVRNHPEWPAEFVALITRERREDDEENWEVARTILHDDVRPDVLLIQEGCSQEDLNYFNTQFLSGYFEFVHVFKTNTNRGQNTAILARPGFRVLEIREDYADEPDTHDVNPESDKLFARGPGFVRFRSPGGREFWVGTNHMKSKSGNSVEATKWRNAEAVRTNQIINELAKGPTPLVIFAGDCNDEIGEQEFEADAGGSAIELLEGTGAGKLALLTRTLAETNAISFGGYRSGRYRSFIDHAVASPEMARHVANVSVFTGDLADVASDHYPVVVELKFE